MSSIATNLRQSRRRRWWWRATIFTFLATLVVGGDLARPGMRSIANRLQEGIDSWAASHCGVTPLPEPEYANCVSRFMRDPWRTHLRELEPAFIALEVGIFVLIVLLVIRLRGKRAEREADIA